MKAMRPSICRPWCAVTLGSPTDAGISLCAAAHRPPHLDMEPLLAPLASGLAKKSSAPPPPSCTCPSLPRLAFPPAAPPAPALAPSPPPSPACSTSYANRDAALLLLATASFSSSCAAQQTSYQSAWPGALIPNRPCSCGPLHPQQLLRTPISRQSQLAGADARTTEDAEAVCHRLRALRRPHVSIF